MPEFLFEFLCLITGGISKTDLRKFITYAQGKFNIPILGEIYSAVPTAELEVRKNLF